MTSILADQFSTQKNTKNTDITDQIGDYGNILSSTQHHCTLYL